MIIYCTVFYRNDGSILINKPNQNKRMGGESTKKLAERMAQKAIAGDINLQGLEYEIIDVSKLPDKKITDRDQWRGLKGNSVRADDTVETGQVVLKQYREELEKENPDIIKVYKLKQRLEDGDYSRPPKLSGN